MVETVEPFKLHPTSISYTYKKIEHLNLLGMGIWLHTYTGTTTDHFPDLGELAETLGNVSVYVNPRMGTTSLCIMCLSICKFFCLTPRMHTGTPRMRTGISF